LTFHSFTLVVFPLVPIRFVASIVKTATGKLYEQKVTNPLMTLVMEQDVTDGCKIYLFSPRHFKEPEFAIKELIV
jgi:hypothetical protein